MAVREQRRQHKVRGSKPNKGADKRVHHGSHGGAHVCVARSLKVATREGQSRQHRASKAYDCIDDKGLRQGGFKIGNGEGERGRPGGDELHKAHERACPKFCDGRQRHRWCNETVEGLREPPRSKRVEVDEQIAQQGKDGPPGQLHAQGRDAAEGHNEQGVPRHPGKNRCRVLSKPENHGKDKAGDAHGNQKRNHARQDKRQEDGPPPKREQAVELYGPAVVDPRECAIFSRERDSCGENQNAHAGPCKLMRGVCGRCWPSDSQRQRDKPE